MSLQRLWTDFVNLVSIDHELFLRDSSTLYGSTIVASHCQLIPGVVP